MQQHTDTPQQAMSHAAQLEKRGDLVSAERVYRKIISQTPAFHPAYHSLGLLAHHVGRTELAIDLINHAIELNNTVGLYHSNLCEICRREGRLDDAIIAGEAAVMLAPDNPAFIYNLALAQADNEDLDAAIALYKEVVRLDPDHGLAWNNLGAMLEKKGDVNAAENAYGRAVAINPDHAEAQNNLGAIYSERGELERAMECFAASIKTQPDFIEPYYNLSSLKTFTVNDLHLAGLKKLQGQAARLSTDAQTRYYFALGKAFEDIAEYDNAFSAYQQANRLKLLEINPNSHQTAVVARIKKIFTKELFKNHPGSNCTDETPVFIVGMPRSGTTLIEQILSSHKHICGAGELKDLHEVILNSRPDLIEGKLFKLCKQGLPGFDFDQMAREYLQRIRSIDANAQRITDKMPANFFYIGFIYLMFPNARIVHSMRDPMDSCFSCYSRLFNETMDFAYDLRTLGEYYVHYIKLMQHWHRVLPKGHILDVVYEDIVADIEIQTGRLLDYIGLPWDGNCLEFYKNKRQVKTASAAQVRKPIYTTSIARWQHFEGHLDELKALVGPYRYC